MVLVTGGSLFVGIRLEGRLLFAFQSAERGSYVSDGEAGRFLTTFERDGRLYVGKVVDAGLATDRVDDIARNVLSIVKRFSAGERLPAALNIFAVGE